MNETRSAWEDSTRHDRRTPPAPTESGVSLRAPVVLVVGVDDDVARTLKAFAAQVDVGFVRVSQGIAASRAIRDTRPTVVGLDPSLWRDEKAAIAEAAKQVGARVVELPPFAPKEWLALELMQAAMDESLAATG